MRRSNFAQLRLAHVQESVREATKAADVQSKIDAAKASALAQVEGRLVWLEQEVAKLKAAKELKP